MPTTRETILTHESIERHRSWLTGRGASVHTVRCYASDLRLFLAWMAPATEVPMVEFETCAQAWLNLHRRVWGAKTTQRRRTALRSFAGFAGMPEVLLDYRAPSAARPVPHPMPEGAEGVIRMVEAAHGAQHRALVALCGLCGLRVHEAIAVRVADVDTRDMTLVVRGKGDRRRVVPISATAWRYIGDAVAEAVLAHRAHLVPLADRTARDVITRLAKRAGLARHVSSHDLRATFGTAAYAKSKNLRAVQDLLGHATSRTTEIYTGVAERDMRDAADIA